MSVGDYFLLGLLKRYKSVHAEEISNAIIYVAAGGYSTNRIPSGEIKQIAVMSKK